MGVGTCPKQTVPSESRPYDFWKARRLSLFFPAGFASGRVQARGSGSCLDNTGRQSFCEQSQHREQVERRKETGFSQHCGSSWPPGLKFPPLVLPLFAAAGLLWIFCHCQLSADRLGRYLWVWRLVWSHVTLREHFQYYCQISSSFTLHKPHND